MALKLKPWTSSPSEWQREHSDWITSALNTLIGQANVPPALGFPGLVVPTVDPTTAQITSKGSRMSSITTPITWVATSTSVTFYWDGTNGSQLLRIGRDDGTQVGPTNNGSPVIVTGLTPSTQYYFYAYWDEVQQKVIFATVQGVAKGTPAFAFLAQNFFAAQQQILRGRIPLGLLLIDTGVATPGSGSTTGSGGSGGGGAGSGGHRGALQ